ncbi:MAG TPA: DinB family protein [Saprospiraceae bacterium]|nr:DinB family protein [Saprospiraceae bacterium]
MFKSDINIPIQFFNRYIDQVPDISILDALEKLGPNMFDDHLSEMMLKADYAYEEGKWTVKQKLQHIIDTERVFSYRAFVFARHDSSMLPSFDQDDYAQVANVDHKSVEDLMHEWHIVRIAARLLFKTMSNEDLLFVGHASGQQLNALALGYAICGHTIHHHKLLMTKYLPQQ